MRLGIIFMLSILTTTLSSQILPIKYFEEAYFTNFHHQKMEGKLQKKFYTPLSVLQHLMKAKTIRDFSGILQEPFDDFEKLEKKQTPNIFLFHKDGDYGDDYTCELEYLVEFDFEGTPMALIGYNLFLDGVLVRDGDKIGRLYLTQQGGRWYLFGESVFKQLYGRDVIYRLGRAFSYLNADNWEYLITNQATHIDADMKEMRYFVVDDKGINISKFIDLTLYWGVYNKLHKSYLWKKNTYYGFQATHRSHPRINARRGDRICQNTGRHYLFDRV